MHFQHHSQPSRSMSFSIEEQSPMHTTPNQNLVFLNSNPINFRRPSDVSLSLRNSEPLDSQSSSNQQVWVQTNKGKSPILMATTSQQEPAGLNLIHEESSVKEYSLQNGEPPHQFNQTQKNQKSFNCDSNKIKIELTNPKTQQNPIMHLTIDQKDKLIYSDIFWNKTNSNRSFYHSNQNLTDQKFKIIRDKADISYEDETKKKLREFGQGLYQKTADSQLTFLKCIDPLNIPLNCFNMLQSLMIVYILSLWPISLILGDYSLLQDQNTNRITLFLLSSCSLLKLRTKPSDLVEDNIKIIFNYIRHHMIIDVLSAYPLISSQQAEPRAYTYILLILQLSNVYNSFVRISILSQINYQISILKTIFYSIASLYLIQILFATLFVLIDEESTQNIMVTISMKTYPLILFANFQASNHNSKFIAFIIHQIAYCIFVALFSSIVINLQKLSKFNNVFLRSRYYQIESRQLEQLGVKQLTQWKILQGQRLENIEQSINPDNREVYKQQLYGRLLNWTPFIINTFQQEQIMSILLLMKEQIYEPNQLIIDQDVVTSQSLFFLLQGSIQVFQKLANSENQLSILNVNLKCIQKGVCAFNQLSFIENSHARYSARALTQCRVISLSSDSLLNLLKQNKQQYQKFKMLQDQIILYNKIELLSQICFGCGSQNHDVDTCPSLHYIPDRTQVFINMLKSEPNQRQMFQRKEVRTQFSPKKCNLRIEEAAILYQQQNVSSDYSGQSMLREYENETIQNYFVVSEKDIESPQDKSISHRSLSHKSYKSGIPLIISDGSRGYYNENASVRRSKESSDEIKKMAEFQMHDKYRSDLSGIGVSPITHIQQPNSGFSQSSYNLLPKELKDASARKLSKLMLETEKDRGSSLLVSNPAQSAGSQKLDTVGNPIYQSHFSSSGPNPSNQAIYNHQQGLNNQPLTGHEKKSESTIVVKPAANLKDSILYNQKKMSERIISSGSVSYGSENQSLRSKTEKLINGKLKQKIQISESQRLKKKSSSLIHGFQQENPQLSNHGLHQGLAREVSDFRKQSDSQKQYSKYGMASSKFTGETAKQFMKNPLEIPLFDFQQSFENSHQFSDYFPYNNLDKALEKYKQHQHSQYTGSNPERRKLNLKSQSNEGFKLQIFKQKQQHVNLNTDKKYLNDSLLKEILL